MRVTSFRVENQHVLNILQLKKHILLGTKTYLACVKASQKMGNQAFEIRFNTQAKLNVILNEIKYEIKKKYIYSSICTLLILVTTMMQFRSKIIFLVRILKTMTWQKNVIKPPVGEKKSPEEKHPIRHRGRVLQLPWAPGAKTTGEYCIAIQKCSSFVFQYEREENRCEAKMQQKLKRRSWTN